MIPHQTRAASSGAVNDKLRRLSNLLKSHDKRCWDIGDLVAELIDQHRVSLGYLARQVGYSKARLSELHLTSRAFPPADRDEGNFYDALMARRIWTRLPRLGASLRSIRGSIIQMKGKRPRQIKAHFVALLLERDRSHAMATAANGDLLGGHGLIGRCHHADWRAVAPELPDGSVKLIIADPPFGGYGWQPAGGYISGRADTSGLRTDSDSNTEDDALLVTLPLFKMCLPKLAKGGCLLLFQPGAKPDRREVLNEAEQYGWDCLYGLTWLKNTRTPTDCSYPYVPSSERLLVFTRHGETLEWHERGQPRADVLEFDSMTLGATLSMDRGRQDYGSVHMFQKPHALCEFLVRKHTHPGELVFEPFGCSGSGVIAAGQLGRRWVYCESNDENFRWGSQRVQRYLIQSTASIA